MFKGAAAQVEHGNLLVLLLLQAIGERRGRGFVDDPLDLQPGDPAGVLVACRWLSLKYAGP